MPDFTSFFFAEALRSAENLEESNLGLWDQDPPYDVTQYVDSPSERHFTERLGKVMHGRRLRLQQEEDLARDRDFEGLTCKQRRKLLCRELRDILASWERLTGYLADYKANPCEMYMAEHLLQWRACKAVHLREKWEALVYT